ncbi:MAG: Si-specific NAD(P)(+) transhydrogenase [Saprospirales bacterium]|nr:Si-specific NAD(P)(+) transhydrogenase [Saprospirales bacterium]
MPEHFDLIVIGSGPAGEKGAAQAAYFGKKVALIERAAHLGGAGINTGTVPSKTLRETALYFSGLRQRGLYGIDYTLQDGLTIGDFMYRKRIVVESEWGIIRRNLERHNIHLVWGEASFKDTHTVRVQLHEGGEADLSADFFLIATGSAPFHPPGVPFDHPRIYDSDTILHMHGIPDTIAVVGGGVIGAEYASIFTALGVQVTLIDSRQRLLPFVDGEVAARLQSHLGGLGLRFVFNSRINRVEAHPDHLQLHLNTGASLTAECALFAAGRQSNVQGLGLETLGVTMGERGLVKVSDKYQTSVPHIYAAGDVVGFPALASTSMEQARVAMTDAFNLQYKERVSPVLPLAVYCIPEISMVGLSEEDCQAKSIPYLVGRALYEESPRGQIIGDTSGMLKLIFSPADKKLLGVHLIGEMSSELIHLGSHVMAGGGTINAFIEAVYNYPTLSDAYKYAAYDGLGNLERWQKERESLQ